MKRPKKFRFKFTELINDLWTHIYGIITVLSFIAALVFTIITMQKLAIEFKDVLYVCISLITLLSFVIIRISLKYSKLHSMSADLMNYERENENLLTLIELQSETTHNITHYFRSLIYLFDKTISKIDKSETITQEEIDTITERNNHFLIILTSSLQNYYSIYTDDNCSVTIKLLCPNNLKVKTVFRDPINLKKRRQAELLSSLNEYKVDENSAFEKILSSEHKDYYFASDNLKVKYENHEYKNSNKYWNNFYNSTIVVPISKLTKQTERHIVGFLTIDNKNGYLVDNPSIEYLFGIADLLYIYILKFSLISNYTLLNNLKNDRAKDYTFGNNS